MNNELRIINKANLVKKYLKLICLFFLLLFFTLYTLPFRLVAHADTATQTAINSGINYLGTQLNGATGQITNGSTGDASSWAAIAFAANGKDPSTVKTSTGAPSLVDYLRTNPPTNSSSATDWEKWILALVASGQNPYDFGGLNYVSTLESSTYYHDTQIGDTGSATDDWFGVLALISSSVATNDATLTNSLSFIISHQNTDGGFGYAISAGSDGNDTAAAIQALVAAKNYGVSIVGVDLDTVISNAKTYLLSTQDASGGFLYDTNPWTSTPDSDSTTWALMGLNALSLQNSTAWNNAATWLISQQSQTDDGFTACNSWDPNTFACTGYASNSTTTSHALIGLAGRDWLLSSYNASQNPTPTNSVTPTPTNITTPTPTTAQPTPTIVYITNTTTNTVTNTVYVTPTPIIVYKTIEKYLTVTPSPTPKLVGVLGATTQTQQTLVKNTNTGFSLPSIFLGMGLAFLGFYGVQIGGKLFNKN